MTLKHLSVLFAAALLLAGSWAFAESKTAVSPYVVVPRDGFVPDADTAAKISEVILDRIFGQAQTDAEKPLRATLEDDIWIVKGTLPTGALGGVAEMHINKKDGTILYLSHDM
jgi:NTF2 fold immunity protein